MKKMLDALWRAVAYCFYPQVIVWSLLPLGVLALGGVAFALWGWQPLVAVVAGWLDGSVAQAAVLRVLGWVHLSQHGDKVAPALALLMLIPLLVITTLLVVATWAMPALARLVGQRRFPDLEKKHGATVLGSVLWSGGYTAIALVLMVVSIPLWFVPPLVLLIPPLIWGWLTSKVMAHDALADYASKDERQALFQRHRLELLAMGVATGVLGSAPSVVWASGALFAVLFVVLVPVAIWLYMLVFVFSALWFSHFCLRALQDLRTEAHAQTPPAPVFDVPSRLVGADAQAALPPTPSDPA